MNTYKEIKNNLKKWVMGEISYATSRLPTALEQEAMQKEMDERYERMRKAILRMEVNRQLNHHTDFPSSTCILKSVGLLDEQGYFTRKPSKYTPVSWVGLDGKTYSCLVYN